MRIFLGTILVLLAIFGLVIAGAGFGKLEASVWHEIEAMLGVVVTAVCLGALYVGAKKG